ncbi:MAG: hypothetical protein NZL93_07245, partial [Chthoniobacterales bacterium]|nr:hypothetical protein [Chthoniobacterales bacterium]
RKHFFQGANFTPALREQLGQMGFLAALGGFRSLVAALLWVEVQYAWERTEWGRMNALLQAVTTLQPRSIPYWDMAAWHMAWNAATAARNDPTQPGEALRIRAERQYWNIGRDYLERGIQNNPDRAALYERLGVLLRDKYGDHCAAAEAFLEGAKRADAPSYLPRIAAYELAKCPGREKEAYNYLQEIFEKSPKNQTPTAKRILIELEEKLCIPVKSRLIKDSKHE